MVDSRKKEIQGLLELWIVKSLTETSRNVSWQLFIKAMSSRARLIATKAVQGSPHINLKTLKKHLKHTNLNKKISKHTNLKTYKPENIQTTLLCKYYN